MAGLDPLTAVFNLGTSLIDKLIPDPAAKAQAAYNLLQLQQSGELAKITAQTDIDKTEAGNVNMFVAGWRPFIGWVCGTGLAYQFVVAPVGTFVAAMFHRTVVMPSLDLGTLMTLLFGMLGLGAYRSYEKVAGVDTQNH